MPNKIKLDMKKWPELQEILWAYSRWLLKHDYGFDSDITCEWPYAVDEFIKDEIELNK